MTFQFIASFRKIYESSMYVCMYFVFALKQKNIIVLAKYSHYNCKYSIFAKQQKNHKKGNAKDEYAKPAVKTAAPQKEKCNLTNGWGVTFHNLLTFFPSLCTKFFFFFRFCDALLSFANRKNKKPQGLIKEIYELDVFLIIILFKTVLFAIPPNGLFGLKRIFNWSR